jgi:tetratricopeptide (TPR) repeat protein
MKHLSSYRPTLLDRRGPEGALVFRAMGRGLPAGVIGAILFALIGARLRLEGPALMAFTLVGALTLVAIAAMIALKLGDAAGHVARYVLTGGDSTPYQDQFSHEQALVMRREYDAALALFEQRIAADPSDPRSRVAAADLYATDGRNVERAVALYRQVQRIPGIQAGQDIYVSNRLADLYLGPLNTPGRALVELRRIVQRYPGTAAAQHARSAIANLKNERT